VRFASTQKKEERNISPPLLQLHPRGNTERARGIGSLGRHSHGKQLDGASYTHAKEGSTLFCSTEYCVIREPGRREPNKTRNTYVLPRQIVGRQEAAHKPDVHLKHRDLRVLKERKSSAFRLYLKSFRNSDFVDKNPTIPFTQILPSLEKTFLRHEDSG
jgi:hypothetical protein